MSADTATDGHERDDGVASNPAAGTTVYRPYRGSQVDRRSDGYEVFIHVIDGVVELIGDRPLVRHGATYEDIDGWYVTPQSARASQATELREMAAGLLAQANRLEEQTCQECR